MPGLEFCVVGTPISREVWVTDFAWLLPLHKAATDMQAFAAKNDDLNLPDQVVLPFIMNFLTDEGLRNCRQTAQVVDFKVKMRRKGRRSRPLPCLDS